MLFPVDGFDWDEANWPKCGKHGVERDEIEHVIANASFVVDDPNPSEKRLPTAGKAPTGRHVFVAFALRTRQGRTLIRPISARYMHRKEIESYEKKWPRLNSDEEAERFVENADLTEFDFSAMTPARFEFEKKSAAFNMRLPQSLLDAVKTKAAERGIPFTRYVRMLIEEDLARR